MSAVREFLSAIIWTIRVWPHVDRIAIYLTPNEVSQSPSRLFWIGKGYHR